MLTADLNKTQAKLDSDLQNLEGKLISAFPDHPRKLVKFLGNDRLVFFHDGVSATIFGLVGGSDKYDLVINLGSDSDTENHQEVSGDDVVSILKNFTPPDESDVSEVMEQLEQQSLKEFVAHNRRLMSGIVQKPHTAFGSMKRVTTQKPETLNEYLPPVDWQKQHKELMKGIKASHPTDSVKQIEAAWDAYDKTVKESSDEPNTPGSVDPQTGVWTADWLKNKEKALPQLPPMSPELKKGQAMTPSPRPKGTAGEYGSRFGTNEDLVGDQSEVSDNPLVNDNNTHGRYAQQSGAITGVDGSDFDQLCEELNDEELNFLYETMANEGSYSHNPLNDSPPSPEEEPKEPFYLSQRQEVQPKSKEEMSKMSEKDFKRHFTQLMFQKHPKKNQGSIASEAAIMGDPNDPRNKPHMKGRWTAKIY